MATITRAALLLAATIAAFAPQTTIAEDVLSKPYCARVGTDDRLRPIPPPLAPSVRTLFGIGAGENDAQVMRSTVWRCMSGRVFVCNFGANLPCGKANVSRVSAGGDRFCKEKPNADVIPMAATGHATIFNWRCQGAKAVVNGESLSVDQRGFVTEFWKPMDDGSQ